jgi:sphinganine-1-phosphate aldolase
MERAVQRRKPLASRLDSALARIVNSALHGYDPYSTVRLAVSLLLLNRVLNGLKRAWMFRSRGLQGLIQWAVALVAPLAKRLPFVIKQLQGEMAKLRADLQKDISKDLTEPLAQLPEGGQSEGSLLELMRRRQQLDTQYWMPGKMTGAIYHGDLKYMDFVGQVYGMFAFTNPLHMKLHPATRQMESEVISMVLRLYKAGGGACGAFTTGGTESILMACKAYREWGREKKGITRPNMICCTTAHAAFDKAAQFFGIELRKAGFADDEQEIDLTEVGRLVDRNTVALVGSAPQYPTGSVDNIPGLSEIAEAWGIGLHVDCCLGGFLLPFMEAEGLRLPHAYDFRVPGVTSISCDPHKYGFAPKGASILMFRSAELRHSMYSYATEWSGGIYATPTILGSRPGGVVAATWAAMMRHGEAGYRETTREIVTATRAIGEAIRGMEGLKLVGRTDVCVVAFAGTDGVNCYSLADALKEVGGWELGTLQKPAAVHLALTLPSSRNADAFIADLREAMAMLKSDPARWSGGTAGLYGTASKMPSAFIEETVKVFLDTMSECTDGAAARADEREPASVLDRASA